MKVRDQDKDYLEVDLTDYSLLSNPLLNKGMAFSEEERATFGLLGLLPPSVATIEEQRNRSYEAFKSKPTDIGKYLYLRDLQDSNETLFYNLLTQHITEMLPIVYTPTVGAGCELYSHLYRRVRGVFIAYPHRDCIDKILANPRFKNVKVIVVSDGERILGLGDLGAGGIGIPIGKLSLYSACAGIYPGHTLPILLDVGTNNKALLEDPLYIGWRHERIRGAEYDAFIEKFVKAVINAYPHVLLQWEDFAQQNANRILEKYRDDLCTFNDDIQGTAAVATGTLLAAVSVTGTKLTDQTFVIVGAGSAGCGISNLLVEAMVEEGLSREEALSRFYLIDRNGLLVEGMQGLLPFQKVFLQPRARVSRWHLENPNLITLKDVIKNVKATVLVGVSGQSGIFTEEIVKMMAKKVERPIIFPLSNPTVRSEATPNDLMAWTDEKVLMGTGSPFPDVIRDGKLYRVDQTNNSYIFPGVGLGLIAVKASKVSDKMFMVAAKALANESPSKKNANANLLPSLNDIRDVSFKVGVAVAKEAISSGLAGKEVADVEEAVREKMWDPIYLPYKRG